MNEIANMIERLRNLVEMGMPIEAPSELSVLSEAADALESQSCEVTRLEAYCRDYVELTGITLNVSDEEREAFNAAVSEEPASEEMKQLAEMWFGIKK